MAKADLGRKRACLACGMRFYDFNRCSIICPGCGAEFDSENIIKSRKGRPAAKTISQADADATNDDQIEDDASADELTEAVVDDNDDDDINFNDEWFPGLQPALPHCTPNSITCMCYSRLYAVCAGTTCLGSECYSNRPALAVQRAARR